MAGFTKLKLFKCSECGYKPSLRFTIDSPETYECPNCGARHYVKINTEGEFENFQCLRGRRK